MTFFTNRIVSVLHLSEFFWSFSRESFERSNGKSLYQCCATLLHQTVWQFSNFVATKWYLLQLPNLNGDDNHHRYLHNHNTHHHHNHNNQPPPPPTATHKTPTKFPISPPIKNSHPSQPTPHNHMTKISHAAYPAHTGI